ncbi:LEM domain-containing protein 2 isoform X1 [Sesbania bispinosa]|nr:LEM domain-containing protein 2 isoform X1 [Sesbania bispinosa]
MRSREREIEKGPRRRGVERDAGASASCCWTEERRWPRRIATTTRRRSRGRKGWCDQAVAAKLRDGAEVQRPSLAAEMTRWWCGDGGRAAASNGGRGVARLLGGAAAAGGSRASIDWTKRDGGRRGKNDGAAAGQGERQQGLHDGGC